MLFLDTADVSFQVKYFVETITNHERMQLLLFEVTTGVFQWLSSCLPPPLETFSDLRLKEGNKSSTTFPERTNSFFIRPIFPKSLRVKQTMLTSVRLL